MSDPSATSSGPSLAVKIGSEKAHPLAWQTVVKRAAVVLVAGFTIYLVFPALTEVLASWPRLSTLDPWWFILAIGAQIAHFTCTFALQRLALRARAWFPVITSALASNAITLIMPGGAPIGAAAQFRMLAIGGQEAARRPRTPRWRGRDRPPATGWTAPVLRRSHVIRSAGSRKPDQLGQHPLASGQSGPAATLESSGPVWLKTS